MSSFSRQPPSELASGAALSRRTFIAGTFGASAALALPAWGADALTVDVFQRICMALANGRKVGAAEATSYLATLSDPQTSNSLAALVDVVRATPATELDAVIRAKGLDALANDIVAMIYSGTVRTGDQVQIVTYDDALVWDALSFTKPAAECGGEFGYWSAPG